MDALGWVLVQAPQREVRQIFYEQVIGYQRWMCPGWTVGHLILGDGLEIFVAFFKDNNFAICFLGQKSIWCIDNGCVVALTAFALPEALSIFQIETKKVTFLSVRKSKESVVCDYG